MIQVNGCIFKIKQIVKLLHAYITTEHEKTIIFSTTLKRKRKLQDKVRTAMCIAALELHQHEATSCRFVAQLADKKK